MPKGVSKNPIESACERCRRLFLNTHCGQKARWCAECRPEARRAERAEYSKTHYWKNRESQLDGMRDRRYRRMFGITTEQYEALLEAQQGVCAICRGQSNGKGRLHVDHGHADGRVRGLLCARCNIGIGYFLDDSALVRAAATYLEQVAAKPRG